MRIIKLPGNARSRNARTVYEYGSAKYGAGISTKAQARRFADAWIQAAEAAAEHAGYPPSVIVSTPAQLEATYYVRWVPQSKKQGAIIALQTLMQVHRFIDGDLPERLIVHRAN